MSIEAMKLLTEIAHIVRTTHLYGPEMRELLEREASLRQSIKQAQKQEPLCTAAMFDDAFLAKSGLSPDTKLYTSPPQRQPDHIEDNLEMVEKQEPVAYIHRNEYNEYRLEPHDNFDIKSIPFNVDVLLFKAPQRQPLTDENVTDGAKCWCEPELDYKDPDTGAEVWIHQGKQ